jgi:hypothetical protein
METQEIFETLDLSELWHGWSPENILTHVKYYYAFQNIFFKIFGNFGMELVVDNEFWVFQSNAVMISQYP